MIFQLFQDEEAMVSLKKQSFISNMQETIHDAWCCNIFFQPSKGCLVADVHTGARFLRGFLDKKSLHNMKIAKKLNGSAQAQ